MMCVSSFLGPVSLSNHRNIFLQESSVAGPGDCHIKGGYIDATTTWTVKLANVSFYKNVAKGLPAGSVSFHLTQIPFMHVLNILLQTQKLRFALLLIAPSNIHVHYFRESLSFATPPTALPLQFSKKTDTLPISEQARRAL
jgi:hypothetical protein